MPKDTNSSEVATSDGRRFCTPAAAAERTAKSINQIRTMVDRGDLRVTREPGIIRRLPRSGRKPGYLIDLDDVEALRRHQLAELGAADELVELSRELDLIRASWNSESSALRARISELEGTIDSLTSVMDGQINATLARAESDRLLLEILRKQYPSAER